MIEKGKIYKLKKINLPFIHNVEDDYEILDEYDDNNVVARNNETREVGLFRKEYFIDPEKPEETEYTGIKEVNPTLKKLESVMLPMNLSFWKELSEDMGGCVAASAVSGGGMASGFSALGAAPCPALGQVTGGNVSGCLVNGVPVAGKSVKKKKKKKKKKHEDFEYYGQAESYMNSPEQIFKQGKGNLDEPDFQDAYNLIKFGFGKEDLEEYRKFIDCFKRNGRYGDYLAYCKLQDKKTPVVLEQLKEDFNEEYEEITEQIAKYLDKLNFHYANTEDIIYKKEGEYKYLFKFDNEVGKIKIKVSKGEEVLVEKEYEIDETKDIQPIFDEIEQIYKEYGL